MGVDRLDPIAHFWGACPANLFPWSILEFPTSTSSKTSSWLDNATKLKRNSTTTFDITILCWVLYSRGVQLYGQLVVEVFVLLKKISSIFHVHVPEENNMLHNISLELWWKIMFLEIFMGPMAVGLPAVIIFQGASNQPIGPQGA